MVIKKNYYKMTKCMFDKNVRFTKILSVRYFSAMNTFSHSALECSSPPKEIKS